MTACYSRNLHASASGFLRIILWIGVLTTGSSILGGAVAAEVEPGPECRSPLIKAIDDHDVNAVERMIASKANLNEISVDGVITPLREALAERMEDVAKRLVEAGADPNFVPAEGHTALMIAGWYCEEGAVLFLLNHKANVNAIDADGYTALMHGANSCEAGRIIAILLRAGADPKIRAKNGDTALTTAAFYGDEPAVILLVSTGAPIDTHGFLFQTALAIARDRVIGRKPSHDRIYQFLKGVTELDAVARTTELH